MVRTYCDRCKKQCKNDIFMRNTYDEAQENDVGSFIFSIMKVIDDGKRHDYDGVDLCEKCSNELKGMITEFMKAK